MTKELLSKMNTNRLLSYFKAQRAKTFSSKYVCRCGCGELLWEFASKDAKMQGLKKEYEALVSHVKELKYLLSTRENITKRVKC